MNIEYGSYTNPIPAAVAASFDWADMSGRDHFVQFYEDDETIVRAVAGYFVHGLRYGEVCIMVATSEHIQAIGSRMREMEPAVGTALSENRFIVLDAHETLAKFMVDGMPDEQLFEDVIGGLVRKAGSGRNPVRAFGEMVAILVDEGNAAAAVKLEGLWNKLAEGHRFRLFCAYPDQCMSRDDIALHAAAICSSHTHVLGSDAVSGIEELTAG